MNLNLLVLLFFCGCVYYLLFVFACRVLAWLLLIPICLSLPNRVSFARVCGCVCCFVFRICLHALVRNFDLTLLHVLGVCVYRIVSTLPLVSLYPSRIRCFV